MSQRLLRVRELLKREIGQVITRDFEFDSLVTVNDVDVTPDLRSAHVYVGVIGGGGAKSRVVSTLNRDHGAIQRQIAKRVVLKFTPQLHFELDESVERGVRTVALLQELEDEQKAAAGEEGETEGERDGDV